MSEGFILPSKKILTFIPSYKLEPTNVDEDDDDWNKVRWKSQRKKNQIPFLRVENWGVLEAGFGGLLVQVASVSRVSGLHGSAAGETFFKAACLTSSG